MAKAKNHTAHNQNQKAHKNGIKRPAFQKYLSTRGMDPKYVKNLRYARKWQAKGRPEGDAKRLLPKVAKVEVKAAAPAKDSKATAKKDSKDTKGAAKPAKK